MRFLIALLLCAGCHGQALFRAQNVTTSGALAPVLINDDKACTTATGGSTPGVDSTGANFADVFVVSVHGTVTSVTDNKSNSYTQVGTEYGTVAPGVTHWQAHLTTAGAGHTITTDGHFAYIGVGFWSNMAVSPIDAGTANGSTATSSTTVSPGATTPSSGGYRLVTTGYGTDSSDSGTPALDNSFTVMDFNNFFGGGSCYAGAWGYLVQTVGAAVTPTWTRVTTPTNQASDISAAKGQ